MSCLLKVNAYYYCFYEHYFLCIKLAIFCILLGTKMKIRLPQHKILVAVPEIQTWLPAWVHTTQLRLKEHSDKFYIFTYYYRIVFVGVSIISGVCCSVKARNRVPTLALWILKNGVPAKLINETIQLAYFSEMVCC